MRSASASVREQFAARADIAQPFEVRLRRRIDDRERFREQFAKQLRAEMVCAVVLLHGVVEPRCSAFSAASHAAHESQAACVSFFSFHNELLFSIAAACCSSVKSSKAGTAIERLSAS